MLRVEMDRLLSNILARWLERVRFRHNTYVPPARAFEPV